MSPTALPPLPSQIPKLYTLTLPKLPPPLPVSCALLLQAVDIPAEAAWLIRCHNPWPHEDVYFCPEEGLPTFVSAVPALTSRSEVWVTFIITDPNPSAYTPDKP